MILEKHEEAFLQTLLENPIWRSILKKMSEFSRIPRYQSGKNEDQQVSEWKYQSGKLDERESLISLLSLSKVKLNLEK